MADLTKHAEHSLKPFQGELPSGEVERVGTRYRSVGAIPNDKHHSNEVGGAASVSHEHLVLRADDALGAFSNTYVPRPVGSSTELSCTLVFPPLKPPMSLAEPIQFPLLGKRDVRERLQLLKTRVEATP